MRPDRCALRALGLIFGVFICFDLPSNGADWLQFRGNHSNGISDDPNPPQTLDKIAWTADLEGKGTSSPLIVGERIVLTNNSGSFRQNLHVTCLKREDGSPQWTRRFWATGSTACNVMISMAVPSPASDGSRIVALFSCNDLVCLDLDGNLLWCRGLTYDYPNATNSLGMASSPLIVDDTVIVQLESDDDSFAMGLDAETGETRWKIDRHKRANWTSPCLIKGSADENLVVLQGEMGIQVVRPMTGETVWNYAYGAATIPSSVVEENVIYVSKSNYTALQAPAKNDKPKVLWQQSRLAPKTSSPIVYKKRIYTISEAGVLSCGDTADGKILWRLRLKGPFSASPVVAADLLYLFNHDGLGQVVRIGESKGEVVSTREIGEEIRSTPAQVDGALYLRSDKHLWKFVN